MLKTVLLLAGWPAVLETRCGPRGSRVTRRCAPPLHRQHDAARSRRDMPNIFGVAHTARRPTQLFPYCLTLALTGQYSTRASQPLQERRWQVEGDGVRDTTRHRIAEARSRRASPEEL